MYFDIGIMWIRDVANEVENIGCRNVVITSERKEEKQTEGKAKKNTSSNSKLDSENYISTFSSEGI